MVKALLSTVLRKVQRPQWGQPTTPPIKINPPFCIDDTEDEAAWIGLEYLIKHAAVDQDTMLRHSRFYGPDYAIDLPRISFLFWTPIRVTKLTKVMADWIKNETTHRFSFDVGIGSIPPTIMFESEEEAVLFKLTFEVFNV